MSRPALPLQKINNFDDNGCVAKHDIYYYYYYYYYDYDYSSNRFRIDLDRSG